MFSTNARRAMGVVAGIIPGFLISFWVLDLLNWTPSNSSVVARLSVVLGFAAAGIIAGLILEKATRERARVALEKNPELRERMERSLSQRSRLGYIVAGIYFFYRMAGVYGFFKLGRGLTPANHLSLILEAVFDGIISLIFLALYFEKGEPATAPGIKKHFFAFFLFFLVVALINSFALIILKPTAVNGVSGFAPLGNGISNVRLVEPFSGASSTIVQAYLAKNIVLTDAPYYDVVWNYQSNTYPDGPFSVWLRTASGALVQIADGAGAGAKKPCIQGCGDSVFWYPAKTGPGDLIIVKDSHGNSGESQPFGISSLSAK